MGRQTDRRVRKTKEMIRNTFIDLINEKGFDSLTVYEISERADINRGTFYLHYKDKYDLLDKSIDDMLKELIKAVEPKMEERRGKMTKELVINQFNRLFTHVQEQASFYKTMLANRGLTIFHTRFIEFMRTHFYQGFNDLLIDEMKVDKNIFINYILFAHLGVLSYWLKQDMPYSPSEMADQMCTLVFMNPPRA